jgi:hypothetical protein
MSPPPNPPTYPHTHTHPTPHTHTRQVRNVVTTCLDKILVGRDPDAAAEYVRGVISDLLMNKLDLSLLVISKVGGVGGGGVGGSERSRGGGSGAAGLGQCFLDGGCTPTGVHGFPGSVCVCTCVCVCMWVFTGVRLRRAGLDQGD